VNDADRQKPAKPRVDASQALDPIRVRRLRHDAKRPIAKNLAEGIALSHALLRFAGVAGSR
jgi:hypothetical protein